MSCAESPDHINLLVAFPYFSSKVIKQLERGRDYIRLVIDSGAFTAWRSGNPIELDAYCRFLETLPITPWRYFTLDVVGDPAATLRNYKTMLARGFTPIPVFTRGECPSVLEDYYETSDVVGLGGLNGSQDKTAYVNGIMRKIAGRRVHWLGFTNINFLKFYKPYMCDCSSWESGARYGGLTLYMGNGRKVIVTKEKLAERKDEKLCRRIRELGFEPSAFLKRSAWFGRYTLNRQLCAASGMALSFDLQKHLGTLMFNACSTGLGISLFLEAFALRQGVRL